MKGRRELRRNMLREKQAMHQLEKQDALLVAEIATTRGIELGHTNFHRPVNRVLWNMPKRSRIDLMFWPRMLSHGEAKGLEKARDQLKEFRFEADEEELEMANLVSSVRVAPPKYEISEEKKRIRPGGRVERRMKQLERERLLEELQNANEFAKALCNMELIRQKED